MAEIPVSIAVTPAEILEEINALNQMMSSRLKGLDEHTSQRKQVAQLIAVGAIFLKWSEEQTHDNGVSAMTIAKDLAANLESEE